MNNDLNYNKKSIPVFPAFKWHEHYNDWRAIIKGNVRDTLELIDDDMARINDEVDGFLKFAEFDNDSPDSF